MWQGLCMDTHTSDSVCNGKYVWRGFFLRWVLRKLLNFWTLEPKRDTNADDELCKAMLSWTLCFLQFIFFLMNNNVRLCILWSVLFLAASVDVIRNEKWCPFRVHAAYVMTTKVRLDSIYADVKIKLHILLLWWDLFLLREWTEFYGAKYYNMQGLRGWLYSMKDCIHAISHLFHVTEFMPVWGLNWSHEDIVYGALVSIIECEGESNENLNSFMSQKCIGFKVAVGGQLRQL